MLVESDFISSEYPRAKQTGEEKNAVGRSVPKSSDLNYSISILGRYPNLLYTKYLYALIIRK